MPDALAAPYARHSSPARSLSVPVVRPTREPDYATQKLAKTHRPPSEVCLERLQHAVGATVAGGDQQFIEGSITEAAHGLAVEVQPSGDRADRPALLHKTMDVLVAVAGPLDDLRAGQFRHRHLHRDWFPNRRRLLRFGVFTQAVAVLMAGLSPLRRTGSAANATGPRPPGHRGRLL